MRAYLFLVCALLRWFVRLLQPGHGVGRCVLTKVLGVRFRTFPKVTRSRESANLCFAAGLALVENVLLYCCRSGKILPDIFLCHACAASCNQSMPFAVFSFLSSGELCICMCALVPPRRVGDGRPWRMVGHGGCLDACCAPLLVCLASAARAQCTQIVR